ncbi:MAG: hypothetical protein BWK78_04935 [Thiotrichaceae bacterium IS1]|nr:MAG: hypothetical protein BWK78_04935 [Thiotrichaceae bacterium IS1]
MIDGGFNGGRQSSCVGSTEPQVGIIDPVVIALFGFVGDPLKYQVVTNPVWRQLLFRLLVMPQVIAPLAVAVGISVVLIIITYQLRQTMMEAQLESPGGEDERCKENCATKYPTYWKGGVLTSQYPSYRYASEFAVKNELEAITGCIGAKKKNEVSAIKGPCSVGKPSTASGTHIVYMCQGNYLGSVGCCPCCQDTLKGPSIKKRFSIIRLGGKMCR